MEKGWLQSQPTKTLSQIMCSSHQVGFIRFGIRTSQVREKLLCNGRQPQSLVLTHIRYQGQVMSNTTYGYLDQDQAKLELELRNIGSGFRLRHQVLDIRLGTKVKIGSFGTQPRRLGFVSCQTMVYCCAAVLQKIDYKMLLRAQIKMRFPNEDVAVFNEEI